MQYQENGEESHGLRRPRVKPSLHGFSSSSPQPRPPPTLVWEKQLNGKIIQPASAPVVSDAVLNDMIGKYGNRWTVIAEIVAPGILGAGMTELISEIRRRYMKPSWPFPKHTRIGVPLCAKRKGAPIVTPLSSPEPRASCLERSGSKKRRKRVSWRDFFGNIEAQELVKTEMVYDGESEEKDFVVCAI